MAGKLPKGPQQALIMIPDISGFTKFVAEVDIEHSQHIIAELLETIIDANQLDMEVSEVEGDAVLFYRFGDQPTEVEIERQAEKMYIDFHTALKAYDTKRVCNCGACSTTTNLGLKVIAHAGEISVMQIKRHTKLMGSDVIAAHRLLKNDVPLNEYLLISGSTDRGDWESSKANYEGLGEISYRYKSMEPLLEKVKVPDPKDSWQQHRRPALANTIISKSLNESALLLSDVSKRPVWIDNLQRVDLNEDHLHRVGDSHQCLVGKREMNIGTVAAEWEDEAFRLVETNFQAPIFGEVSTVTIVKPEPGDPQKSRVEIEVHPQKNNFLLGMLWTLIGRRLVSQQMTGSLDKLRELTAAAAL